MHMGLVHEAYYALMWQHDASLSEKMHYRQNRTHNPPIHVPVKF